MDVIVFEDDLVHQLYPLTIGRPAFAISCGSYRLIDLVTRLGRPVEVVVRPHLKTIIAADCPGVSVGPGAGKGPALMVNARLVPSVAALDALRRLIEDGRRGVVRGSEHVAAALLGPDDPRLPSDADTHHWAEYFARLALPAIEAELPLLGYPHDAVRHHMAILSENLEDRLKRAEYRQQADGVFLAPGATLGAYVVADTARGPIVVEPNASIGPYCYLSGPVHVGESARVIEHSALKDAVSLGHTTKVGGEVEASTIEAYTNKQHHGFLGHSYLGSWVNLGAGTCNSDLKNTYGLVCMEYQGRKVATGMQFLGCMIGDYAKTAINTSIFTGKTIGACSMIYGFVTTSVPSFVNYARLFGQVSETPVEVMVATQARMFKRRHVEQRPCDVQLLHDMYELTRHERHMSNEPLSL